MTKVCEADLNFFSNFALPKQRIRVIRHFPVLFLRSFSHKNSDLQKINTIRTMLEIKNLNASVEGKEILRGVNLTIREGEVHVLMGPNGSGKSTLSHVLVGNPKYEVTEGSITFRGKDLLALSPEDRSHEGIFMSFQAPTEIPGVSMTNFMRAALNAKRKYFGQEPIPASEFLKILKEKRKLVGLDAHFMSRGVNEGFSGGERKRNEIFQMAVLEPFFSILDETDSGLDVDALRIVAEGKIVPGRRYDD